jgi:hypothetical protein
MLKEWKNKEKVSRVTKEGRKNGLIINEERKRGGIYIKNKGIKGERKCW